MYFNSFPKKDHQSASQRKMSFKLKPGPQLMSDDMGCASASATNGRPKLSFLQSKLPLPSQSTAIAAILPSTPSKRILAVSPPLPPPPTSSAPKIPPAPRLVPISTPRFNIPKLSLGSNKPIASKILVHVTPEFKSSPSPTIVSPPIKKNKLNTTPPLNDEVGDEDEDDKLSVVVEVPVVLHAATVEPEPSHTHSFIHSFSLVDAPFIL